MPDSHPVTAIRESNEYEIVGLLAQGGMGSVYRGRARTTGEQVVLKSVANIDREVPRFLLHEFEIIRELAHPNIVRAFDLFRLEGRIFIALEHFNGIECFRALEPPLEHERDGLDRLLIVLMQIFDALKYLHDRHILHGEFTPPNILLDDDLHVKVVDFELARRLDRDESDLWEAGTIVGTPRYMAPEQLRGSSPDTASDLFTLGLIIFEWLHGESPFGRALSIHDQVTRVLEQPLDEEFLRGRGATPPIASALARMLDPDPSKRTGRHVEFFKELRQALLQQRGQVPRPIQANVAGSRTPAADSSARLAHQWDVAISFAGPDRAIAKRLATLLKDAGLRVFYDMDHQASILGADLLGVLEEVYSEQSRYCILLVSEHYSKSTWAWLESRHALIRALAQRTPYVLPIRLDDAELKGLPKSIVHLDVRDRSIEEIAGTLIQTIRPK
jgi:serine/threonine protein kinase